MKRFTETTKWRDVWHRRLTTTQKCLWSLLCDTCDHAGIFEFDEEMCGFDLGSKVTSSDLDALGDRVRHLYDKKWIIVKFIQFQYGKLSHDCKPHRPVYAALQKHDLTPEDFEQNASHRGLVDGYLRDKIIIRDGGRCAYTGKALLPSEIAIDHVQPRSKGGNSKPSNLVCMDARLNCLKSDMGLEEFCIVANLNLSDVRERLSNTLSKGINTLQEKDKEKDKEKETEKETEKGGALPNLETPLKSQPRGTLEELKAYALEIGLPTSDGSFMFDHWSSNGWKNGENPSKDWKAGMRKWKTMCYLPSQKGNPTPPKQQPYRSCL